MKTGDVLGFREEPGKEPDAWADIVAIGKDGEVFVRFGELRLTGYAPGVIQDGIANGLVVVKEK